MCLLQVYPDDQNMSVKSACSCSCIADPLTRHSEIITKAELDADMNDMIKSKWNRICPTTSSSKRRNHHRKADSFRDHRKKSANIGVPNANNPKPQPPQSYNENVDMVTGAETTEAAATTVKAKEGTRGDFDVVDTSCLERVSRIPAVSDLPKMSTISKQVHFDEDHMVELIEFPDDEESEEGRKCYWEVFARDRCRFKDRISQAEDYLKNVLLMDHRQRVYTQRFLPLPLSQTET